LDETEKRLAHTAAIDQSRARYKAEPDKNEPDCGNARISGLIAACRIARNLTDDATLAELLPKTRRALRERLIYELAHSEGGVITPTGTRTIFGRWRFLTPDLARGISLIAKEIEAHLVDVYVDHHRPAWHIAWNVELLWRNESPFSFPTMSLEVFNAKGLILREKPVALASYLDLPWCKGDECYIQKLAIVLANAAEPAWK
jgi:hypothetical protein